MPHAEQPEDLARLIAEIERRVRTLEATSPLTNASIQDGRLRVLDSDLEQRVVIGKQPDGTYGIWIYNATGTAVVLKLDNNGLRMFDAAGVLRSRVGFISAGAGYGASIFDENGNLRFEANDDGLKDPYLALAPVDNNAFEAITAGAFTDTKWRAQAENISHLGLFLHAAAAGDAGTTGEIRLRNSATGGVTNAVAVPAGAFVFKQFKWLHGGTLGTGPVQFALQARRTGGAGNINVYQPTSVALTDPGLCTAGGT